MTEYTALYRLARKSRMTPIEIPTKGLIAHLPAPGVNITEMNLLPSNILSLYRQPLTRDGVIDYFTRLAQSEEIALTVLYYSDRYKISPFLTFAVVHTESRFKPTAVGRNPGSVDRGLFQLNSKSFPQLNEYDFFNIDINTRYGIMHLDWCLTRAKGDVDKALAIYNAGETRVVAGRIPESTKAYVRTINSFKNRIMAEFTPWLVERVQEDMLIKNT